MSNEKTDLYYGDFNPNMPCWYQQGCKLQSQGCKKRCQQYLVMNWLITSCGKPNAEDYLKTLHPVTKQDLTIFKRLNEIKDNIVDFVQNGNNLYIVSKNLRNGKTSWAIKLMYRYFDRIWHYCGFTVRGYFIYLPDLITKLKTFSYRETKEFEVIDHNLKNADIVIWDDISSMELTANDQNVLNTYLGLRVQKNLSNIYTGYYTGDNLNNVIGERLSNRILNSEIIELTSPSLNAQTLKIMQDAEQAKRTGVLEEFIKNYQKKVEQSKNKKSSKKKQEEGEE